MSTKPALAARCSPRAAGAHQHPPASSRCHVDVGFVSFAAIGLADGVTAPAPTPTSASGLTRRQRRLSALGLGRILAAAPRSQLSRLCTRAHRDQTVRRVPVHAAVGDHRLFPFLHFGLNCHLPHLVAALRHRRRRIALQLDGGHEAASASARAGLDHVAPGARAKLHNAVEDGNAKPKAWAKPRAGAAAGSSRRPPATRLVQPEVCSSTTASAAALLATFFFSAGPRSPLPIRRHLARNSSSCW